MYPVSSELRWKLHGQATPAGPDQRGSRAGDIPPIIQKILANRGLTDPQEIERFLSPSLDHLPLPSSMLGMARAVEILIESRVSGIPVLVHGDYDADGVCATALIVRFFREVAIPVSYFIPDRMSEGYGLSSDTLPILRNRPELAGHPAPILLTVDCGISSLKEIAEANELGFRVIVTDHHQPGDVLPPAEAILNPHQTACAFPFRDLSGVGVAFYLVAGLRSELVRRGFCSAELQPNLKKYLSLVAIGSVADMVPLQGVNRILVKVGIEMINRTPEPGIKALVEKIGQGLGRVTSESIAFQLAPRINAAGRTGSAEQALLLLMSEDYLPAKKMAEYLDQANDLRKSLGETMYQEALTQARSQLAEGRLVLVVADKAWHHGIAGLVASKLARHFSRPTIVLSIDDKGVARGSARSVGDFDILACLDRAKEFLLSFGGHRLAAGVSMKQDLIGRFRDRLADPEVAGAFDPEDFQPQLAIDLVADPVEVIQGAVLPYLARLEPFGVGNPEPIFCSHEKGVRLSEARKVGGDSLRFKVRGNGKDISGVAFGQGDWAAIAEQEPVRLAYRLSLNCFKGKSAWEIRVEDIRKTK